MSHVRAAHRRGARATEENRPGRGRSRRPWMIASMAVVVGGLLAAAGVASANVTPHHGRGTAPVAAPAEPGCTLVLPPRPLTARGLATPYRLTGPRPGVACPERAFVQGTVVDTATGALSIYNPLVIDDGTRPAVAPTAPRLPAHAVVGLWFGFNGDTLRLRGQNHSLADGRCVDGLGDSPFGQYAYCDAPAFFRAATAAVRTGKLKVPALGTGRDGEPCPTTRDFTAVDQDQSDNVTTTYLARPDGATAQNTAANRAALGSDTATEVNGSDNILVDAFLDTALRCRPFTAPDLADHGTPATSLALNELQATGQAAPVALVPPNDPMTEVDGRTSVAKLDLYRAGVDQDTFSGSSRRAARQYCWNLVTRQPVRLLLDRRFTVHAPSPDPGNARNLFVFLARRLKGSFEQLGCADRLGLRNPAEIETGHGAAVDARLTPVPEDR